MLLNGYDAVSDDTRSDGREEKNLVCFDCVGRDAPQTTACGAPAEESASGVVISNASSTAPTAAALGVARWIDAASSTASGFAVLESLKNKVTRRSSPDNAKREVPAPSARTCPLRPVAEPLETFFILVPPPAEVAADGEPGTLVACAHLSAVDAAVNEWAVPAEAAKHAPRSRVRKNEAGKLRLQ